MIKESALWVISLAICLLTGCNQKPETTPNASTASSAREVVVYTALDRGFSEPILDRFEKETGIKVRAKYDTESTKTIGLVNTLRAEADRPRCDVFWNNEIVNTIRLKKEGLLAPYASPAAAAFPSNFRDSDHTWTGFAARARIFLVNTDLVPAGQEPEGLAAMTDPKWQGRVGIAKPLFGSTASHASCLRLSMGAENFEAFCLALLQNQVSVEAGNKQVALAVSSGKLAFGLTDTDDAIGEVESGKPVKIVYPDSKEDERGTLFIPNTVALIANAPHPEAGKMLIDYLLSPAVEIALAHAESAQIPLNPEVEVELRVKTPAQVHAMPVDFNAAADQFAPTAAFLKEHF